MLSFYICLYLPWTFSNEACSNSIIVHLDTWSNMIPPKHLSSYPETAARMHCNDLSQLLLKENYSKSTQPCRPLTNSPGSSAHNSNLFHRIGNVYKCNHFLMLENSTLLVVAAHALRKCLIETMEYARILSLDTSIFQLQAHPSSQPPQSTLLMLLKITLRTKYL
jgi:hypothetical protein